MTGRVSFAALSVHSALVVLLAVWCTLGAAFAAAGRGSPGWGVGIGLIVPVAHASLSTGWLARSAPPWTLDEVLTVHGRLFVAGQVLGAVGLGLFLLAGGRLGGG